MDPLDRSTIWPYDERGEPREFYYSRYGNPTVAEAEARLGELDGGTALLYPSGSGATTALVLGVLSPGDTIGGASATSSSTRPGRRPRACSSSGSRRRRTRS
jgi:cystathionine beta-lyase/cystathionine gamma-synthase